jgi:hypothetical protein
MIINMLLFLLDFHCFYADVMKFKSKVPFIYLEKVIHSSGFLFQFLINPGSLVIDLLILISTELLSIHLPMMSVSISYFKRIDQLMILGMQFGLKMTQSLVHPPDPPEQNLTKPELHHLELPVTILKANFGRAAE